MRNEIVWEYDDGSAWHYALIGQYDCKGQTEYVFGSINDGYNTKYTWEVVVSTSPAQAVGYVVDCGDANDLDQIKRDCEYIGKEWIKGDSPLWAE